MPYNPKTHHRINLDVPNSVYKKIVSLARELDHSIRKTAYGLIITALTSKERDE